MRRTDREERERERIENALAALAGARALVERFGGAVPADQRGLPEDVARRIAEDVERAQEHIAEFWREWQKRAGYRTGDRGPNDQA